MENNFKKLNVKEIRYYEFNAIWKIKSDTDLLLCYYIIYYDDLKICTIEDTNFVGFEDEKIMKCRKHFNTLSDKINASDYYIVDTTQKDLRII